MRLISNGNLILSTIFVSSQSSILENGSSLLFDFFILVMNMFLGLLKINKAHEHILKNDSVMC